MIAARDANMTRDTIDRAIKRGSGTDADANYDEVRYEGYGPGGVALIVEGLTNKEIGRALDLSPRTVETHRANLFAKLQAESLAQLIRRYATLVDADQRAP